jgi:hypothetical protein
LTDHFSVLERSYRAHHGEAPAGLSAPPATAPGFVGTHAASAYPT